MKGAFETCLIMFFGMFYVALGTSLIAVTLSYNDARMLQDALVSAIENQNGYSPIVDELVQNRKVRCHNCVYAVNGFAETGYEVSISFPIVIPLIQFQLNGSVKTLTQPVAI